MPATPPVAPVAERRPATRELHGVTTSDDYAWLRDREDAAVLGHLAAERAYYAAVSAGWDPLRAELAGAIRARLGPEDTPPWRSGGYAYWESTAAGAQYPALLRRPVAGETEQVVLDLDALARGSAYCALGVRAVSPDGRLLAVSVDLRGDEVYHLQVLDIASAEPVDAGRSGTYYGCAWAADSGALLYVIADETHRPWQVRRWVLGAPGPDPVVLEEPDQRFEVTLAASRSGRLAVLTSASRDTTEVAVLPTADLGAAPRVIEPRRRGRSYWVDHWDGPDGGELLVLTDDGAVDFRVVRARLDAPGRAHWRDLMPGVDGVRHVEVVALAGGVAVLARRGGRPLLRIVSRAGGLIRETELGPETSALRFDRNEDPAAPAVRVVTESLVEPPTYWDVQLATGAAVPVGRRAVPAYRPQDYVTQRTWATAPDGTAVPMTLAHRRGLPRDGTAPWLLYGYGAYEDCADPEFSPAVLALLDRGIGYAVAHVRGGGELGRRWWLDGRLRRKPNTFRDFVACADHLASSGLAAADRIAARGLSAGGLLAGAVFSAAPRRWRAVLAEVPFVDVVNTLLDPTIPLTVTEWDEWGDPRNLADHAVLAGYSPYDNPPPSPRPHLLVTGSLADPRVLIHEPAKWVARLRATSRPGDGQLLFRPELGAAAHTGPSGRYDAADYEAEVLAFLLDRLTG